MATEASEPRGQVILEALTRALGKQGAARVDQLGLGSVASAIDAALPVAADASSHPLDRDGDGLETDEINAANDV